MDILKLSPVFKDYIWGGTRLKTDFGFKSNLDVLAEGWMLSCHKDGMNTAANMTDRRLKVLLKKRVKKSL